MSLFVEDDEIYEGNNVFHLEEEGNNVHHIEEGGNILHHLVEEGNNVDNNSHDVSAVESTEPVAEILSESLPTVTSLLSLKFQKRILQEVIEDDSLLIMAPGLGLTTITAHLLHLADVSGKERDGSGGSIVFLLGASPRDNQQIADEMREIAISSQSNLQRGLTVVNVEKSNHHRRLKIYRQGGIFSVSSQALLDDMLTVDGLDLSKVTGVVVVNAHNAMRSSRTPFALMLFRQMNKYGFIKALSQHPDGFVSEFNFQRYLTTLQVKKVLLWPRYHVDVVNDLNLDRYKTRKGSTDVVEIGVSMTESMKLIQMILLVQMQKLSSQIRSDNRELIQADWSNDDTNALQRKYSTVIRLSLRKVWYKVSQASRNFVTDLEGVEGLLENLTAMDAVSFFEEIKQLRSADGERPTWLDKEEGETLYTAAQQRAGKEKSGNYMEEQPKYELLVSILDEISAERIPANETRGPVLIMCKERRTILDLKLYLTLMKRKGVTISGQSFMKRKLKDHMEFITSRTTTPQPGPPGHGNVRSGSSAGFYNSRPNQRRRVRGGSAVTGITRAMAIEQQENESEPGTDDYNSDADEVIITGFNEKSGFELLESTDIIILRQYQDSLDDNLLFDLRPSKIIMYEADISFIRRLEIYRRVSALPSIRPYFFFYTESVEEGRFLYAVRHEKDIFTKLIREKAKLPVILNDGDVYSTGPAGLLRTINTRIAGGGMKSLTATTEERRVIVDTRELRSATLSYILHQKGIKMVPMMLTVGDFIVSPDICIERKSIPDLISSFNSGRLYQQCVNMFRYYDIPILLIEFEDMPSVNVKHGPQNLLDERTHQRLSLLLQIFPKLKIIWSFSADHSAEIILNLKLLRAEPDPRVAVEMGTNAESNRQYAENQAALDTLLQLPGVNEANHSLIIKHYKSIREIADSSKEELEQVIGTESANQLHKFLNQKPIYT